MMQPMPPEPDVLLAHAAFVRAVARATIKDDSLAEDVVQETWLAALRDGSKRRGPWRAWLSGVARRQGANLARKREAQRRRDVHGVRAGSEPCTDDVAARAEVGRLVVGAVLALDAPYRDPLLLRYFDGLPPREIAERLSLPVETVRTRIKRGLGKLREKLDESGADAKGWRALLLPLAGAPLAGESTALTAATFTGKVVGGLIMGKKLVVALVALVLLGLGGSYLLTQDSLDPDPDSQERSVLVDAGSESARAKDVGLRSSLADVLPIGEMSAHSGHGRISGQVVDEELRSLAGVRVVATRFSSPADGEPWVLERDVARREEELAVRSDASGHFVFRGLSVGWEGRYRVQAEPPSPRVGSYVGTMARREPGVELVLHVREGAVLRGRVLDPEGMGLAALIAVESSTQRRGAQFSPGYALREQPTQSDGTFNLVAVPLGPVRVSVRVPGRLRVTGIRTHIPHAGELLIRLGGEGAAQIGGTVRDAAGVPVSGARVRVDGLRSGFRFEFATTSAEDGTYQVRIPGPCSLRGLRAQMPGYVPVVISGMGRPVAASGSANFDLVLQTGGRVEGRVLSDEGRPLAGVRVQSRSRVPSAGRGGKGRSIREVQTDAEGRFVFDAMAPGDHLLRAELAGFYLAPGEQDPVARGRTRLTWSLDESLLRIPATGAVVTTEIRLLAGLPLNGRVLDEAGRPVAAATIRASLSKNRLLLSFGHGTTFIKVRGEEVISTSDVDGYFRFVGIRPNDHPYWLQAQKADLLGEPLSLTIQAGAPLDPVTMRMRPGGFLAGRTVDMKGQVLPEAEVVLEGPSVGSVFGVSDVAGHFRFGPLAPGTYDVGLSGPYEAATEQRTLGWGEEVRDLVLRAPQTLGISGVLVGTDGEPRARYRITFEASGAAQRHGYGTCTTDEQGRFEATDLVPGTYRVLVGGQHLEQVLEAGSAGVHLALAARPVRRLEGLVLDPAGQPLARGVIRANFPAPGRPDLVTGRSGVILAGRFSFSFGTSETRVCVEILDPLDTQGNPISIQPFKREEIDVASGPLTFRLRAGGATAGSAAEGDIAGVVLDGDGAPLARIGVRLLRTRARGSSGRVETDVEGRFRFEGLREGRFRITLAAPPEFGLCPSRRVRAGETDLRFVLQRGGMIAGRVLEVDGSPAGGVFVQAVFATPPAGRAGQARTGKDGGFSIGGLDEDRDYRIRTVPGGPGEGRRDLLLVHSLPVRVGATDVELRLVQGVYIRGRVLDEQGKPAVGMMVVARPTQENPRVKGTRMIGLSEGKDGAFAIGPLPAGTYDVTASSTDVRIGRTDPVQVEAPAQDVTLRFGAILLREGVLAGEEVTNFRVSWTARKPDGSLAHAHGRVAADGTFVIGAMADLSGVAYFYRREDQRYALVQDVRPGDEPLEVSLRAGLAIEGRALTEVKAVEGRPGPSPGSVVAQSLAFDLRAQVQVASDGRFRFTGLPAGDYELRFYPAGTQTGGPTQTVAAGTLDVELLPD